jgi:hypothetical protein
MKTLKRISSISAILLVSANLTACFHWVPIEPSRYADGQSHDIKEVRVGPPASGEVLEHVQLTYPMMVAYQGGQPVSIDLRQTPVQERRMTRGSIAGIVIGSVLGGVVLTAGIVLGLAYASGGGVFIPQY